MGSSIKIVMLSICALAISACSTNFRSNVTAFHALEQPKGQTIAIVPIDTDKVGSLEFANYAAFVGQEMSKLGYKPAGDAKPDLVVGLDYSINDGREKVSASPFHGSLSYWDRVGLYGHWGSYDPFFSHRSNVNRSLSVKTVYKSEVKFEIRHPNGKKLYEARADAETRTDNLTTLVPNLITSIFVDFPGPSGVKRRVTLEPKK